MGLGASAGGLDAFLRLVRVLTPGTGLAYVLVQHLAPDQESLLPDLLARVAAIPVVPATDGLRIAADHAYVIPPNTTMTVTDGHLRLVPRRPSRGAQLPVDAFLESLARVHGAGAAAVILSGAGADGARGVQALKEAGGITFAQEAASARFPSMPEAAIATGCVDFVLTPEEIGEQLGRLGKHLARLGPDGSGGDDLPAESEEEAVRQILTLLHRRTGLDFQHYRRGTVHRRILRRMLVHRQDSRTEYLAHVRRDPAELDLLHEDLLIGVTSFFRDPEVFATLQATAFPALLRARAPDDAIRVWVAGCAGGEEAYSIAIALLEVLGDGAADVPIQIFASDVSEASVAQARAGRFPRAIEAQVSPERLARFFDTEEGGYRIAKSVRDLCVFSRQNILRDPPFSHLDLISCRNVLIYLEPPLQRRVFPIFHYALRPQGLLLLGTAESPGSASEFFSPLVKRHRLFARRPTPTRPLDVEATVPVSTGTGGGAEAARRRRVLAPLAIPPAADEVAHEADRLVLARFAPPGVVVNDYLEILHFRGDTSHVLAHAPGAASLDLLRLARPEFALPLRAALAQARADELPVVEGPVVFVDGARHRAVTIEVLPFRPVASGARFFTILFVDGRPATDAAARGTPATSSSWAHPAGEGGGVTPGETAAESGPEALRAAREELAATRRYLQHLVEQHEATTEELRAASEEIQSSNEELHSTNEELETTKEEIQSANEELTTVNEELRHRNRELAALSADLANVLAGTTLPIAIVGSDLRLRRFTPALERVMTVIATDVGRPISDLRLHVPLPDLGQLVTSTVETLAVTEREVRDEDGRWWAMTIRPYQTVDRRVDGAVLVFSDIDASKRAGERAEQAGEERRQLLALSEDARATAEDARAAAERANSAKGKFLASMSHDLRTPLNAIGGYAELLAMGIHGPVTPTQQEDLARIRRSARHLLSLINDILNFARVEAGHVDLHMGDVPVAMVLAELEALVAPQLAAKSLRFVCGGAVGVVHVDPEKLQQVLLNLLSNAIKFTPREGQITVASVADEGRLHITVSDTGCGIPVEQREHVFEPFAQVGRGLTTPAPDGVGLGLAISRELMRAMGGDLTLRSSTPGVGSTFALTVRLVEDPDGTPTAGAPM